MVVFTVNKIGIGISRVTWETDEVCCAMLASGSAFATEKEAEAALRVKVAGMPSIAPSMGSHVPAPRQTMQARIRDAGED